MAASILFMTELLGLKVYDLKHRVIGRVADAALVPAEHPVRVDRYFIGGRGWAWMTFRYDQVRAISLKGIELRDERLFPYHSDPSILRLERDLLDQQIIDANGRKVVRVTDITFEITQGGGWAELCVQEVDVGLRSILRRLAQGVLPRRAVRRIQTRVPPNSIPWRYCNIVEPDPQRRLRLNISFEPLEKMHPADLADIVEELSPEDREAIIEAIDTETAAETISELEPEVQAQILESLETERAADILEEMDPDEAADALGEMEEETSEEILEEMEGAPKAEVEELLEYDADTAGGLMTPEYLSLHAEATAGDAADALRSNPQLADSAFILFLTDLDERLVASLPVTRALLARPDQVLSDLAEDEEPLSVPVGESSRRVVELFDKYNLLALPVVDEEGRMAGVVTVDDVISVLRED
jgi:CBS domain-containing protein